MTFSRLAVLISPRNERVQFRREVHSPREVDDRLSARNRPLPIHQRPQRVEREARALRGYAGIQAQHVEHDRSQLRLQGVGTVGHRLARGLARRGKQVARLIGAVLPAQIALQFGLYRIGLGSKAGAAEPSRGAFDRLGERRLIVRELLQNQELRVDDHHRVIDVGPLIALDQIDGGRAGQFALVGFRHRLEGQRDQANLPQRVESGLGAARSDGLRAAHQVERGERLFGVVVQYGNVLRLEVRHRLALLVAHDEVQQDFIHGGLHRGSGALLRAAPALPPSRPPPAVQPIKCRVS